MIIIIIIINDTNGKGNDTVKLKLFPLLSKTLYSVNIKDGKWEICMLHINPGVIPFSL